MTLNVVLANLTGTQTDTAVLNGAWAVASTGLPSHIHSLFVRPDPTRIIIMGDEGISPSLYQTMIDAAQRADSDRLRRTRAHFDKWRTEHDANSATGGKDRPSADFRDEIGDERKIFAQAARLADITVTARPTAENRYGLAFETALLDSGRPVLLVPLGSHFTATLSNIMIAWNDSPEAARAVSAAFPLLKAASTITVFTAAEGRVEAGAADMLVRYLADHDIKASVCPNGRQSNQPVQEKLLSAVRKAKSDVVVLGAYSHSRVRELVFGGVTRHMLTHSPVALLMAH
jgi:nucleotide-binding universal stress UspA family protein